MKSRRFHVSHFISQQVVVLAEDHGMVHVWSLQFSKCRYDTTTISNSSSEVANWISRLSTHHVISTYQQHVLCLVGHHDFQCCNLTWAVFHQSSLHLKKKREENWEPSPDDDGAPDVQIGYDFSGCGWLKDAVSSSMMRSDSWPQEVHILWTCLENMEK